MLTATKEWTCECECSGCNHKILPGDNFNIKAGTFYKIGHSPKERVLTKPKIVLTQKRSTNIS
jgi:hypothetical protein